MAISPSNAPLIANTIKAANPKIPVMTLDADLDKEDAALRKTYLGTDNYLMGQKLGEYIKKAKPERRHGLPHRRQCGGRQHPAPRPGHPRCADRQEGPRRAQGRRRLDRSRGLPGVHQ